MKRSLLLTLASLMLLCQTGAEESYSVAFYRDYLDPYASDYSVRRREALHKAGYLHQEERQKIHSIVTQNDLTHMSFAKDFQDLWSLRYHGKWQPEVLLAVAETARFYIEFCDTNIETGFNREVGILHHILQDLRSSEDVRARVVLKKLIRSIQELKQRHQMSRLQTETQRKLQEEVRKDIEETGKELQNRFREALKKALLNSALYRPIHPWGRSIYACCPGLSASVEPSV